MKYLKQINYVLILIGFLSGGVVAFYSMTLKCVDEGFTYSQIKERALKSGFAYYDSKTGKLMFKGEKNETN